MANIVNDRFPLQPESDELPNSFRAFNLAKMVELLAADDPQLAQKVLNGDPDAAQALGQFAESKLRDLQQRLGPAKKSTPSGKPGAKKSGSWDTREINGRVKEILRSR